MYSIGQFAKKTGLTVRALRFYSDKGLLVPCHITDAGHRYFDDASIEAIQKIVTLKYLDYSLEQIEEIIHSKYGIIESLQFQKEQLEKKRAQIDQIIMSLDQAISIGQKSSEVNTSVLLSVIFNLMKEDEQRAYMKNILPSALVDRLFNHFNSNLVEANQVYVALANRLKDAYASKIEDHLLQSLIEQFFSLIPADLATQIELELRHYKDFEIDEWLFPSPFTKEEEEWIICEAQRLGLYGGVTVESFD